MRAVQLGIKACKAGGFLQMVTWEARYAEGNTYDLDFHLGEKMKNGFSTLKCKHKILNVSFLQSMKRPQHTIYAMLREN